MPGATSVAQLLFTTTININGMWSGYTGEGMKTILPHVARARLDSRLVPNQTPDGQLELIRKHLDAKGFTDVKVRKISGYPPAQTSVETPIVHAAISVFNKHGVTPAVAPRLAGSAPLLHLHGPAEAADGDGRARTRQPAPTRRTSTWSSSRGQARRLRASRRSKNSTSTSCMPSRR